MSSITPQILLRAYAAGIFPMAESAEDNALYWNFVVVTWLPLYACLYWIPRL